MDIFSFRNKTQHRTKTQLPKQDKKQEHPCQHPPHRFPLPNSLLWKSPAATSVERPGTAPNVSAQQSPLRSVVPNSQLFATSIAVATASAIDLSCTATDSASTVTPSIIPTSSISASSFAASRSPLVFLQEPPKQSCTDPNTSLFPTDSYSSSPLQHHQQHQYHQQQYQQESLSKLPPRRYALWKGKIRHLLTGKSIASSLPDTRLRTPSSSSRSCWEGPAAMSRSPATLSLSPLITSFPRDQTPLLPSTMRLSKSLPLFLQQPVVETDLKYHELVQLQRLRMILCDPARSEPKAGGPLEPLTYKRSGRSSKENGSKSDDKNRNQRKEDDPTPPSSTPMRLRELTELEVPSVFQLHSGVRPGHDRYTNIYPWSHNRVPLHVATHADDYVNASSIILGGPSNPRRYIAMQAPTEDSTTHVWRMLVEQTSDTIVVVQLTRMFENQMQKAYPYFPIKIRETTVPSLKANVYPPYDTYGFRTKSRSHGLYSDDDDSDADDEDGMDRDEDDRDEDGDVCHSAHPSAYEKFLRDNNVFSSKDPFPKPNSKSADNSGNSTPFAPSSQPPSQSQPPLPPPFPSPNSDLDDSAGWWEINQDDVWGDGWKASLRFDEVEYIDDGAIIKRKFTLRFPSSADDSQTSMPDRTVWHLMYTEWPDYGTPMDDHVDSFLRLMKLSRDLNTDNANPRAVHCSAGIGRTGTFIALDHLLQELEAGRLEEFCQPCLTTVSAPQSAAVVAVAAAETGKPLSASTVPHTMASRAVSTPTQASQGASGDSPSSSSSSTLTTASITRDLVFETVDKLRQQRYGMVYNEQQYSFLYKTLRRAWEQKYAMR